MGAFYSGSDGWMYVQLGEPDQNEEGSFEEADKAAAVTDWSIQASITPIETTTLGDTDTVYTAGLRTTTGSCTLLYYKQNENASNKAGMLMNAMMQPRIVGLDPEKVGEANKPQKVAFKLGLTDDRGIERFIYCRAYLTSVSTAMAVGDVMRVTAQFRVLGAPNQVAIDNSG